MTSAVLAAPTHPAVVAILDEHQEQPDACLAPACPRRMATMAPRRTDLHLPHRLRSLDACVAERERRVLPLHLPRPP
jgi:hypothetical protein